MTAGSAAIVATAGGSLLPLAILLPALGVLHVVSHRRPAGRMDRAWPHAGRARRRCRHRMSRVALRPAARLHARRLCAPARHRAQSRRIFRRHARDGGTDRASRRALRPDQFRYAAGDGKARAARLLDPVARHPGGVEPVFLGGDLFNLYVGLELLTFAAVPLVSSRRTSGDSGRGAALSPVRAVRLGVLSARRRLALRSLWHARHRAPCSAYSPRACRMAGGRADDRGAVGEDCAFPSAFVAASRPRQRAGRSKRGAVGAGGEGIVLPRCPALV